MTESRIVIRKCNGLDEISACVALQKEVWNFADAELMPLRMFVVAEKIGGQVIGAFDDGKIVAFALSVPGSRGGHSYLHSQMLAVRSEYRNAGLGRQIKLFQRDDALARGFELIEWTFDPLEIKNAYLNIERLGAIARRYHVNQYGITSSPSAGRPAFRSSGRGVVAEIESGGELSACSSGSPEFADSENNFGSRRNLRMEGGSGHARPRPGSSGLQPERFSCRRFRMGSQFWATNATSRGLANSCWGGGTKQWIYPA